MTLCRGLTYWCLLVSPAGANLPGQDAPSGLLAPGLVEAYRGDKDLRDPNLLPRSAHFLQQIGTFDKQRLAKEFNFLWEAATKEQSEPAQSGMYGAATALLFMNPKGSEIANAHLDQILNGLETASGRGKYSILKNLSRTKMQPSDAQVKRMTQMVFSAEQTLASRMATVASQSNPDHPAVLGMVRTVLDSYSRGSMRLEHSGIVSGYLEVLSRTGTTDKTTIGLVKEIATRGHQNWRASAAQFLKQAVLKSPDALK